jgi:hypothetical protein
MWQLTLVWLLAPTWLLAPVYRWNSSLGLERWYQIIGARRADAAATRP